MAEAMGTRQRMVSWQRLATIAATLFVAACSTIVPKGPPPPVTGPAQTRPSETGPIQGGIPTDNDRDRVALLVPLTGQNAGVGKSLANATQMALLDTGSAKVRITTYDTNGGAAAAANRALADGNKLILGPLLAEDVRAIEPIASRAHVPIITFSNDASVAGDGVYLLGYVPSQAIDRVVSYAQSRGVTTFAGLMPNGLYGQRASTAFLRSVEDAGGQVVSLQTYDRSSASVSTAVKRMAAKAPYGAVLIADSGATAAMVAPTLKKAVGMDTRLLGTELWNTESSIASKTSLNGAWFASVPDELYRQYAVKYRSRFGAAPYRLSSLGYDAVLLTVRVARDWRPGSDFPQSDLRDPGGFSGIDGAFRFGRDGIAQRALEVQEIRDGRTVVISPAPTSFGK
ncbi:penicillin-binding protein activator [Hephaestia mangrovi]|uniref:penicillin-binding protein activator n=1 Tax=Hephaestia mangrovi TaxID=2873268 RepID=UPI001CA67F92|nr:penicillin-binding protein activator [Hephaestia mangrovi]MBY8828412.1 penicillin-binding protein activator [Hephaestia mangrovi]